MHEYRFGYVSMLEYSACGIVHWTGIVQHILYLSLILIYGLDALLSFNALRGAGLISYSV